jgi:beta-glucuronidase
MNLYRRATTRLDGPWRFHVDPLRLGEDRELWKPRPATRRSRPVDWSPDAWPTIMVPADWNTERPEFLYYEGLGWYARRFDARPRRGRRCFLYFEAANYLARVFLNGEEVGRHEGGFTPFVCEVTGHLRSRANALIVMVDSTRRADGVPTLQTDWFNYGGLTRSVHLVDVPAGFVSDFWVRLEEGPRGDRVVAEITADGMAPGAAATVRIPALGAEGTCRLSATGRGCVALPFTGRRWSPERPVLYRVEVACGRDALADDVGFRTVAVRGNDILLNGEPIFFRGMCCHEESPPGRRAMSGADIRRLVRHARDLDLNGLRLAHYPHSEAMVRAADRAGLLLWAEVPVYWGIQFHNPRTLRLAKQQLSELILRDRNRASVILWSMANETPESAARLTFIRAEAALARRLDPTRLITAACFIRTDGDRISLADPLFETLDVVGVNEYKGWYDALLPRDLRRLTWPATFPKPVIVSEFGAGAAFGRHGPANQRWTEEYQEALYRAQFAMLDKVPYLRGLTPWLLFDFRSPRRFNEFQRGYNRKGLLDHLRRKKKAFFVVRDYYAKRRG